MQFAKDSVYMALRERLARVNPSRTIEVDGVVRPGIVVIENSVPRAQKPLPGVFYVLWGGAKANPRRGALPLISLEWEVLYWSEGSDSSGVDRGRSLTALDEELLAMCVPSWTAKKDYTQPEAAELGTSVFWDGPLLEALGGSKGGETFPGGPAGSERTWGRRARLTMFFFPEPEAS